MQKWMATGARSAPRRSSSLAFDLAPSSVLDVEPDLASRLNELRFDQWKDRVAILTIWLPSNGPVTLVKAEILQKAVPTVKKVGYTHKGHVDYETLTVSAQETRLGKGDLEQWEKVGRMYAVAKHFKDKVKAYTPHAS